MRYTVIARWWNGKDWDMTKKDIDTKDKVIGAVKLLLKETTPYQISITDTEQANKKEVKNARRKVRAVKENI